MEYYEFIQFGWGGAWGGAGGWPVHEQETGDAPTWRAPRVPHAQVEPLDVWWCWWMQWMEDLSCEERGAGGVLPVRWSWQIATSAGATAVPSAITGPLDAWDPIVFDCVFFQSKNSKQKKRKM